ncbi:TonB-dependent receptor plug domain-containing protein [Sphingosinicella sp. LY1275]|uniref:TonB-dependent receptor plug domain-containing protein n=1 Tax=Sphingosinicella sp. LY1275 TaxID=3095379 RepID=UPI002ADEAF6B|nr:TonB-dependent receptor plug domain-containing protein [Sphingosinicella sp. LY1275]MEA1014204.1 TonB-dependent receptor plug domain-containing protein [Sphingosinicella sp. LY1275]
MRVHALRLTKAMLLLSTASAAPASAQETGNAPPPAPTLPAAQGAKSYTPADFARFSPKTALDMLRQVPGFTIQQQDERRGLGQATANVLINGQRMSGKSNDVVTELGRISASNVARIDIVDGATLDVPGLSGQVANIVTAAKGLSGSFAWRPQARLRRTPPRLLNGEASISGTAAGIDYTVSLSNDSYRNGNAGPEIVFTPDRTIIDRRAEVLDVRGEVPKISGSFRRQGSDGSIANLNASASLDYQDIEEISLRSGPGQPDRDRLLTERRREWNYEVGGDYEFALGGGRLKLIGLRSFEHTPYRQILTTDFADGRPRVGDRFEQVADEAETIARGEYRWKSGGADWQVSAEGALNILDVANSLSTLDAAGAFVAVPLPNSVATVEEKRGEIMLSYGRPLSPALTLQSSAGGEYSQLSQSGEAGLTRTFLRPKGFVSLAWKASPRLDVSVKLQREVGQLNFFDFVASANVSGGTTNAGNVNLVPQQSWNLDIEATRNLGPWGTATARLFGRQITDIVDIVPIGETGQAPGNLDSATIYGIQWTSTFNFDPIGWRGAKLDLDLQYQKSRLEDPVTGVHRPINENEFRRIIANFRHDVPETDWAYGWGFENYGNAAGYRLDQRFRFFNNPGNLGIFVEHKDVYGLTVRGSVDNILGTNEAFDRSFYDRRRTNALLFTESRDRFYGPILTVSISGKI